MRGQSGILKGWQENGAAIAAKAARARAAFLMAYAQRRPAAIAALILVVMSAFFLLFQNVDIALSRLAFDPETQRFMAHEPVLQRLRALGLWVPKLIVAALVVSLLVKLLLPHLTSLIPPQVSLFFLSTLILGPGLLVNGILKAHSGRPRPRQTDLFGGDLPFMPPWSWSDHCARNCSFVSGEASSSFFVLAIVFVVPRAFRAFALCLLVPYVLAISYNRVLFGGHYVSDIVIAWPLNFLMMLAIYRYVIASPPPALSPHKLEQGLATFSAGLRQGLSSIVARASAVWRPSGTK